MSVYLTGVVGFLDIYLGFLGLSLFFGGFDWIVPQKM